MADIEILTKDTAEVTAGEKYSARATGADQDTFFAEMRPDRADYRHISYATKTDLTLAAINPTPAWTKYTGISSLP